MGFGGDRGSDRGFRGGGGRGGGFSQGPREMHTVTCSSCGQEAQVPFKPAEGRPVYCKDCYRKQKDSQQFN
ncbi:DNA-directed RNA polymerase [Candidatus Woesearchaeota archaeon]|nr:DNA-directed RNA polymerase [Candidatus Woesearchaeota archaeon]